MSYFRAPLRYWPVAPLSWIACLCALVLFVAVPLLATAQQTQIEDMKEFNAGDINFRTHVHLEFASRSSSQVVLMPPEGFSGAVFRTKSDGTPGWGQMLKARGYNAYMFDNVGCGATIPPPSRDLLRLTDKATWGAFQIMVATHAQLVIAQGFSAGFAIRGRSQREDAGASFVLIDPVGPQGSQDFTQVTPAELVARRTRLDDALWQEWGWGKRAHRLRSGTDLSKETADSLLAHYERDQPNYRMTLLTGLDAGTEVKETMNLRGVPVLVVRTSSVDREQLRREEQVVAWLENAGCLVDRLDLSTLEGATHTTGLPWAGDEAEVVLDRFLEWFEGLGIRPVTSSGSR